MKRITGALCAVFALSATFAGAQGQLSLPRPATTVAEFARGVKFTVSGYTGTEVLTNFPVLVRLSDNSPTGFHYSDFTRADYQDICFVDMQTNGLPYQVDTWKDTGESLVWVTLPVMTNGTEFVMWYHSSSPGSLVCDKTAWGDYAGVWHMNETGDSTVTISDATTNHLDATTTSSSFAQPNGRIGGARIPTKNGSAKNTDRIEVNLDSANNPTYLTKRAVVNGVNTDADHAFTVSIWIKPEKYNGSFEGPNAAYLMGRKTDDNKGFWGVQFHYDNSAKKSIKYNQIRVWRNETGGGDSCWHTDFADSVIPSTASSCYGNWYKLDVVYSGTTVYFYVNGGGAAGSCITNVAASAVPANGTENKLLLTGTSVNNKARPFRGDLDEFRLRAGAMSADWVKADFDTVDNTSFLSAGAVESVAVKEMPFAGFGLLDSGAAFATFSSVVTSLGDVEGGATSCDVFYKLWKSAETEANEWTLLRSGISALTVVFTNSVTGLTPGTAYSWKLKAKNNLGDETEEIGSGSFTTSGAGVAGVGGETYRVRDDYVHRFTVDGETTSYQFTPPSYVSMLRALIVAGGGPGGYNRGGGGGAGGLVYDAALSLPGGTTYTVNVGTGGVASVSTDVYGVNGGNSSIVGGSVNLVVYGGGAGGNDGGSKKKGVAGGSGGGSAVGGSAGTAIVAGQGNNGGNGKLYTFNNGGGGGGATEVGGDAANAGATLGAGGGGAGFLTDISGERVCYAGGGGGGSDAPQSGKVNNIGSGGDGGGGNGGSSTVTATAGTINLGGGGGGGYFESAGGNGGSGVVILRYAVQGNGSGMPEPAVSLTSAAYNGDAFTADVVYRLAWAGSGHDTADVLIAWGYSPDSLVHTNAAASDVIGIGTFSVPLRADQRTVYLRAVSTNATGHVGVSTETRSIYVEQNDNAVDDDVSPVLANVGVARIDGAYVVVTGVVTVIGQSDETCTVNLKMGLTANSLSTVASGRYAKDDVFALTNSALSAMTEYYWQAVAVDDAGTAFATEPATFTTLGPSFLNAATVTSDQRTLTLEGSLSVIGGGVTYVLVKWNNGEWESIGSFTQDSASGDFSTTFTTPTAWGEATTWAILCSNAYVTAEGVPTGEFAVSTPSAATGTSGSITLEDKATYTWQPVNGDWNGNWSDTNHWASDKAVCIGYPSNAGSTASFKSCTLENPVVVNIDGKYAIKALWPNGTNASDVAFVGNGRDVSGISADLPLYNSAHKPVSNTKVEFRDLWLTVTQHWSIMRDDTSVTNLLARLSGVTIANATGTGNGVNILKLATPYSRLELVNFTTNLCNEISFSGTDSVMLIADSYVRCSQFAHAPLQCNQNDGMKMVFRGTMPKLVSVGEIGSYQRGGEVKVSFEVPVGGYAEPPIVITGTSKKFAEGSDNRGTAKYLLEVSADSPVLKKNKLLTDIVLVDTQAGIYTNNMYYAETIGTLPSRKGVPYEGAFKYGLNGEPLADGDDVTAARQILLDLNGVDTTPFILYLR